MHRIVKQPDGKLAVWSTVVDSFVLIDAEQPEVVDFLLDGAASRMTEKVAQIVASLERGGKPYSQFTRAWDEYLALHEEIHGEPFAPDVARESA